MQVVAVGLSHNSSSVSLRGRLAVGDDALPDVLWRLHERVEEAFVLSTCNRVELYAVCGHETSGADVLRRFLAEHGEVSVRTVCEASYAYGHEAAVRHLLRVAAGIDSAVLGENEILGQVRRALIAARNAGTVGPVLDRLGDTALACGKRVRSLTALGRDAASMTSVALRLTARERGGLDRANVVVLGAGAIADQVLAHLESVTGVRVTVLSRTFERATAVAVVHRANARPWTELADALVTADVVVGCTSSTTAVLDAVTLARARADGDARPLFCLDLAVPRDMDPGVADLPGVTLIDVDRLEVEAATHRAERARDLARAETIVAQESERYMDWWRGRGVASTVARLHARADAIRNAELERALARLPELAPHARAVIGELATRIVGKLLHEPTVALKGDPEGANMAVVVERLFGLTEIADISRATTERHARDDVVTRRDIQQESMAT